MISIIIPVINEADTIVSLLEYISKNSSLKNISEIIIVDGGSQDKTRQIVDLYAKKSIANIRLISSEKGRARQMNTGARSATGTILYFLHADSFPPNNFDESIISEIQRGEIAGCFRMRFDNNHPLLKFSQWFTRFNIKLFRGGDQSLFISNELFDQMNGYDEQYLIYEDCEFISRLYKKHGFTIIPDYILTSARKYDQIGTWKLQYHFAVIHLKNSLGVSAEKLYQYYERSVTSKK
ncbi:MAG: rSAM/selenodomain-associated transferase 2 [Ulvibacter sp.]|jgi:rSAM/selenodomain-associated transferase 2